MGETVYALYTGLRKASPQGLVGYGLPYAPSRPTTADMAPAAGDLDQLLETRAEKCRSERVVLAGYSAGAWIVGDTMQSQALTAKARDRLAAVVLLSDPRFNPADTSTAAGTFDPGYGGDSGRRPAFAEPLAPRTHSYCRRHDIVCQQGDPAANKDEHGRYAPEQTCEAIAFIESVARLRSTPC